MVLLVILPATATPAPGDLPHRARRWRRVAPVTLVRVMLLNEPVMRHAGESLTCTLCIVPFDDYLSDFCLAAALAWAIRGGIGLLPRDTTVGA